MTLSVTHAFVSAIADDPAAVAAGEVVPSNWNAGHALSQATGKLLGRTTAGTGSTEEITPSAAFSFAGAALDLASTISAGGPTGSATVVPIVTYNANGQLTAVSSATIAPAATSIASPAALTKADDTNVTLTLGGTPSTALLRATSITAGWTGTLGVTRGGTGTGTAFTAGSVVFAGASGVYSQDNTNFFWDDSSDILKIAGELDFQASTASFKVNSALLLDYGVTNAATWSMQNGTTGQILSIYNTLSGGGANYEKLSIDWTALGTNTPLIWCQKAGTGTARQIWMQSTYGGNTLRLQFGDNDPNGAFGAGAGLTSDSPDITKFWVRSDDSANTGGAALQFLNSARDSIQFVQYDRSASGTVCGVSIGGVGFLRAFPQTDLVITNESSGKIIIAGNTVNELWRFSPDKTVGQATLTVVNLPAAGTAGRRAFVTNATATTFASIVAGGGANNVPVYDDGTNWRIG